MQKMLMPLALSALGAIAVAAGPANADSVADFYKGKQVKFIMGAGVGGGYDAYGRVLARYLGRHIPGNPKIIAQNMPGGGSLKLTNFMYNKAARDGTVIGSNYNTITLEPLIGGRAVKFDPLKLNWLGSMGKQPTVCVIWKTSKTKTLDDAMKRVTVVGATSPTGNRSTQPKLYNFVLGTKFKVITGYSTAGNLTAVEKGEVEGLCGTSFATIKAAVPHWIRDDKIRVIMQFAKKKDPSLKGVPMLTDRVKDPKMLKVLDLFMVMQEIGRPIIAPPGLPADRLAALQNAVMATLRDPNFLAEAKKLRIELDPIDHKEINGLLKSAYATPKDIVKIAAKIVERPKKKKKKK
jgi:tripartite-type tricarboxylate transporter receptor subunit TctC